MQNTFIVRISASLGSILPKHKTKRYENDKQKTKTFVNILGYVVHCKYIPCEFSLCN